MKLWGKLSTAAPMLGAGFLAVCVGVSLGNYTAPAYTPTKPAVESQNQGAEILPETTTQDEKEKADELLATDLSTLADGTYTGSATGYGGKITVAVTVQDHKITSIDILNAPGEDASFFNRAKGVIDQIIHQQSTEVDTVTGATFSSRGIINAVKNALTGQNTDSTPVQGTLGGSSGTRTSAPTVSTVTEASEYRDGVYTGSGIGFGGKVQVQVTISGGKIAKINVVKHSDDTEYMQKAQHLLDNIVSSQSTNVDTVSGATYSSAGLIEAVRNALSQAAVSGSGNGNSQVVDNNQNNNGSNNQTPSTPQKFPYKDGVYHGSAMGYAGYIQTALIVEDEEIKAILILEHQDDEDFFKRAAKVINEIIYQQRTDVDLVSGATYSSRGIRDSVLSALEQARRVTAGIATDPDPTPSTPDITPDVPSADEGYKDGTYNVTVACVPDSRGGFDAYNMSMKVTIKDQKITEIKDITWDGDSTNDIFIKSAVYGRGSSVGVVDQILKNGLPKDIDAVSGATCTSKSIVDACVEALNQAMIKEEK